jgi:hypothetical protein
MTLNHWNTSRRNPSFDCLVESLPAESSDRRLECRARSKPDDLLGSLGTI